MIKPGTQKAKDTELSARFTEWYCTAHHGDRSREPLVSEGSKAGIYGKRPPVLCVQCTEYVLCVEVRTEKCPKQPKPFCTACDTKCYKPEMSAYARAIMRYSGPRSLLSRYWRRAVKHIIQSRLPRMKES